MTTWNGQNPPQFRSRTTVLDRLVIASLVAAWIGLSVLVGSALAGKKPHPQAATTAAAITLSPAQPSYGDDLTVSGPSTNNVFNVTCEQNGNIVYGDGGNANDPTVTLASLAWTGGAADCVAAAREWNPTTGDVDTVAELAFGVTE